MGTGSVLRTLGCSVLLAMSVMAAVLRSPTSLAAGEVQAGNPYPGASHVPDSKKGWQNFLDGPDKDAPFDEAQGGRTARGTPLQPRDERCFPSETRNLFYQMDQVPSGPDGKLEPFAWHKDGKGRDGIRGQNTWVLWGEGNEAFWGWIQERGYGLIDFMVMLDSRQRTNRFRDTGLMNQPGMKSSSTPLLGLYLDEADGERILLQQPEWDIDASTGELAKRPEPPPGHPTQLFEPGDPALYADVRRACRRMASIRPSTAIPAASSACGCSPIPISSARREAATARGYWKNASSRQRRVLREWRRRCRSGWCGRSGSACRAASATSGRIR